MKVPKKRKEEKKLLITRETDYALRILRALANGEHVNTAEICRRELLPQQFTYKILKKLERAGLICITRGKEGGCILAADLRRVSLYDLMEVMDSEKFIAACTQPDFSCAWRQTYKRDCKVHRHLQQIQEKLDGELQKCSLSAILSDKD